MQVPQVRHRQTAKHQYSPIRQLNQQAHLLLVHYNRNQHRHLKFFALQSKLQSANALSGLVSTMTNSAILNLAIQPSMASFLMCRSVATLKQYSSIASCRIQMIPIGSPMTPAFFSDMLMRRATARLLGWGWPTGLTQRG